MRLFRQANALQFQGRLQEAVETYQRSIDTFPTAEAYTFLGWTYSWTGRIEDAIAESKKAIEVDPDYGNPYNDIGAYLLEMGREDEAIPWLRKAMAAERYESPHFPHLNIGRVWIRKGMWDDALAALHESLRLAPDQRLPPLPAILLDPPDEPEETDRPTDPARLAALEAMKGYIEARNAYDPTALIDRTALFSRDARYLLLVNLARAKMEGSRLRILEISVEHFSERIAVLHTPLEIDEVATPVSHLVVFVDGRWKVAGLTKFRTTESKFEQSLNGG